MIGSVQRALIAFLWFTGVLLSEGGIVFVGKSGISIEDLHAPRQRCDDLLRVEGIEISGLDASGYVCRLYGGRDWWIDNTYRGEPDLVIARKPKSSERNISDDHNYAEVMHYTNCTTIRTFINGEFMTQREGTGCEENAIKVFGKSCIIDLIQLGTKPELPSPTPSQNSNSFIERSASLIVFLICDQMWADVRSVHRSALSVPDWLSSANLSVFIARSPYDFRVERYPIGILPTDESSEGVIGSSRKSEVKRLFHVYVPPQQN